MTRSRSSGSLHLSKISQPLLVILGAILGATEFYIAKSPGSRQFCDSIKRNTLQEGFSHETGGYHHGINSWYRIFNGH
jgi:hypothetical protein